MSEATARTKVHITVCGTCVDGGVSGEAGIGGGERMHALLQKHQAGHPMAADVVVAQHRCLMACARGCAISVATRGKVRYLLGDLPVNDNAAAQIVDFAVLYGQSASGMIENHAWPGQIEQYFLGRIPPIEPTDPAYSDEGAHL